MNYIILYTHFFCEDWPSIFCNMSHAVYCIWYVETIMPSDFVKTDPRYSVTWSMLYTVSCMWRQSCQVILQSNMCVPVYVTSYMTKYDPRYSVTWSMLYTVSGMWRQPCQVILQSNVCVPVYVTSYDKI